MKILLVNVDAKFNIAIRKLYNFYTHTEHSVEIINLNLTGYPSNVSEVIDAAEYNKVYCSNLFEINQNRFKIINCIDVIYGGIGSINPKLKLDKKVEKLQPYYFDHEDTSHGSLSRGCNRGCWFCKVTPNEGKLHRVDTLNNIIQHKKVIFYDNNIFALEECVDIFKELIKRNIKVNFNQGLDFRLVTNEKMKYIVELKYMGEYIFAFDDVKYEKAINKKLPLLKKYIPKDWGVLSFTFTIMPKL